MKSVPPGLPLCVFVGTVAAMVVARSPIVLLSLSAPVLGMQLASSASRRLLMRRLLWVAPLAGIAVALRFLDHAPNGQLWTPILRVSGAVAWSTWLSTALSPRELDDALRALRVPAGLVDLIAQTRRFSGQLSQTSRDAWHAAVLRSGLSSTRASARTAGLVAGVVVVRAFDRAENVAVAQALRGALFHASARTVELEEHG